MRSAVGNNADGPHGRRSSAETPRPRLFFGGLDANRVAFTRGRDLQLEPPASERLNFLVYPRVEVDGVVFTGVAQRFSFAEVGT